MSGSQGRRILARCVVCRGDIYQDDSHETWEGGFYCERHGLTHLRGRAEEYRRLLREEEAEAQQA